MHTKQRGFTLIELLVVVSILAILVIIALSAIRGNRQKADDARTKADLARLRIAFEDYYGDHNCYPPPEYFDDANDCGADHLKPYLSSIACSPKTKLPYPVVTDPTGCVWWQTYAILNNPHDEAILNNPLIVGNYSYNYSVTSSNIAGPSDSLPAGHTYYYCSSINNCTTFNHNIETCTPHYTDNPNCDGGGSPCQSIGSCSPN